MKKSGRINKITAPEVFLERKPKTANSNMWKPTAIPVHFTIEPGRVVIEAEINGSSKGSTSTRVFLKDQDLCYLLHQISIRTSDELKQAKEEAKNHLEMWEDEYDKIERLEYQLESTQNELEQLKKSECA